jgi:hypothetical protein
VAGASVITVVGVFLGLSPWFEGLNHGGHWSLATKTDFWSGLGLVVIGLATIMLYQMGAIRGLQAAGVLSRPARLEENTEDSTPTDSAPAAPVTDAELLRLASAVVRDIHDANTGGADAAPAEGALQPRDDAPPSEDELVRLATQLLAEIKQGAPVDTHGEKADSAAASGPLALMSEPELARMAADLLQEIQQSQSAALVRTEGVRHE